METELIEQLLDEASGDSSLQDNLLDFSEVCQNVTSVLFEPETLKEIISDYIFNDGLDPLEDSVIRVANDFGHPVPEVYHSAGSYGELSSGEMLNPNDDRIGADIGIVDGINEKYGDSRAYDVITAHEMTHAKIAALGLSPHLSSYAEEVICDIYSGAYSGTHGLPKEVFEGEIGWTPADSAHPSGAERLAFYNEAYRLAEQYPQYHPFYKNGIDALVNNAIQCYNT